MHLVQQRLEQERLLAEETYVKASRTRLPAKPGTTSTSVPISAEARLTLDPELWCGDSIEGHQMREDVQPLQAEEVCSRS